MASADEVTKRPGPASYDAHSAELVHSSKSVEDYLHKNASNDKQHQYTRDPAEAPIW